MLSSCHCPGFWVSAALSSESPPYMKRVLTESPRHLVENPRTTGKACSYGFRSVPSVRMCACMLDLCLMTAVSFEIGACESYSFILFKDRFRSLEVPY